MRAKKILAGLVSAVSTVSLMASMTANAAVLVEKEDKAFNADTKIYENTTKYEVEGLYDFLVSDSGDSPFFQSGIKLASYFEIYGSQDTESLNRSSCKTKYIGKVVGDTRSIEDKVLIGINADSSEMDSIIAELKEKFCNDETSGIADIQYVKNGRAGTYELVGETIWNPGVFTPGIQIEFKDQNHEVNKAVTLKLADYMFANYDVDGAGAYFAVSYYVYGRVYWEYWYRADEEGYPRQLTADDVNEINPLLAENGYNVQFVETIDGRGRNNYALSGTDEMTESELYKLGIFMKQTLHCKPQDERLYSLSGMSGCYTILRDEDAPDIDNSATVSDIDILAPEAETLLGDANCDGKVDISDAVLIMQFLANPEKYPITAQGLINADIVGNDGVTALDALQIQMMEAGSVD